LPDPQGIVKADGEKRCFEALDLPGDATVEQVRDQEVVLAHRHRAMLDVVAAIHHSAESATAFRRHADGAADTRLPEGVELCWFCKRRPADPAASWTEDMYRVVKKTNLIVSRRFQYRTVKVPVPRCKKCMASHDTAEGKSSNVGCIVGLLGIVAGIVLGIINRSFFGGLVTSFIFGLFGFGIAYGIAQVITKPRDTKSLAYAGEYDSVKALQKEGWHFGKEPSKND
jgi:hypothetical protein